MIISEQIEFSITSEYGASITCFDRELADELDDYLTDNFDFDISFDFRDTATILYVRDLTNHEDVELKLRQFLESRI